MERQSVWQETFDFFAHHPIVVEPVDAHLSTDAGLLPIRQLDKALGLTDQFAAALIDRREGPALTHTYLEMTRMRVYGILADYEDQNDIDGEPRVIAGRVDIGVDEARRVYNVTADEWYLSIQDAIDDASDGNEIVVYPGTYKEDIDFNGKLCSMYIFFILSSLFSDF